MAGILGFGGYVPERVMTNDDWAKLIDTSDEWITSRSGIKERRFAAEDESTADFACNAGSLAIADAGLTPDDIDELIVATDTPEVYTPDTASFVQHRLGMREVPAFDLGGSGCAGWRTLPERSWSASKLRPARPNRPRRALRACSPD